jgi:hypothetical protein
MLWALSLTFKWLYGGKNTIRFSIKLIKQVNNLSVKMKGNQHYFLLTGFFSSVLLYGCTVLNNVFTSSNEVQLIPQKTEKWCWAASAEMCMKYLGETNISQCEIVNNALNKTDCCSTPTPPACINGNFPDFGKYNYSFSRTSGSALSWMEIRKQLGTLKKPIAFSWMHEGGGGHMMVVTGYTTIDGINWLYINDPLAVNIGSQYSITYDEYVMGPTHSHWDDFYNLTKNK